MKWQDYLAKEATEEAELMEITITILYVKSAVRKSVIQKLQNRWNISEQGRNLYELKPTVGLKTISE